MSDFTVEAIELTRLYGGRAAVSDVSFNLARGQVLGFLGPNGAGKSTTMKMLTGNLAPTLGSVKICGIDMIENPKEAKKLIGYLPETKERCGLGHMSKRLIENLSNGYQQRVGIAQAIIHNPTVVILDEPTVGLDPIQIRDIRTLIKEIGQEHSVIVSTHILPEVEMVCDHVQIIDQGKLVFNGDIDVLKRQRMGNKLLVGFNQMPELEKVAKIKGVSEVELTADNMMRIAVVDGEAPHEAIVKASVRHGWGLYQIAPDQTSLEDVFVQLTYQDGEQTEAEETAA